MSTASSTGLGAISSLGIGSGLDLNSLVDNMVQSEQATAQAPLDRRELSAQSRLSAYGSLKSAAANLYDAVHALADFKIGRTATSGDESVATATASADAALGNYQISVQHLASAQSLATSAASRFASSTDTVGTGTLTLAVDGKTADIAIAAGSNSLADVADAINGSGLAVQAAVVNDGSGYRLLLTSGVSGTAGKMTLTTSGSLDSRLASASMDETAAAQDAQFQINGLSLTSSSNTITDVLPGLTVDLHGVSPTGTATKLSVATDQAGLSTKLNAVVTAYNALQGKITASSKVDISSSGSGSSGASSSSASSSSVTNNSGPLVGDATLRALQDRLGTAFSASLDTGQADNPFSSLVDIGLHTDASGTASLDPQALSKALATNGSGVQSLLSAFGSSFGGTIDAFSGSDGILDSQTQQLNSDLRDIGQQRDALDTRMQDLRNRLTKQFSALDTLVSQFKSTSNYLSQQLANLPG